MALPPILEGSYASYDGHRWAVHDMSWCVYRVLLHRRGDTIWANIEDVHFEVDWEKRFFL